MYERYDNNVNEIVEAQEGNTSAMENLIQNNQGLIWSIVKRFNGRGYDSEDLYQIACLGFIKCIKKFDTSFDVRLSTYAVPYILGEIKRFIQDDGPIKVSRSLKELNSKIAMIQKEYLRKSGRDISIEDLAKELKVSKDDIIMALDSKSPVTSIYEYTNNQDEEGQNLLEKISSNIDEQTLVTNKIAITQLIKNLGEKERQVILLRYYKEKTQTEVAKILGVTQVQISRIEKKTLKEMKKKLTENPIAV